MYWLLPPDQRERLRQTVSDLASDLSNITGNPQIDQLFPFVGRKDRRKAEAITRHLSPAGGTVVDPFVGSGTFAYAAQLTGRRVLANEWEPATHRLASAPWQLPRTDALEAAIDELRATVTSRIESLYTTRCVCGAPVVFDSLFFDREPLRYRRVKRHQRLGRRGENVTYRGAYKCGACGATEKHFDESDEARINALESSRVGRWFASPLIENARINLSRSFLTYGHLFPLRSKVALTILWEGIQNLNTSEDVRRYLEDVVLSIMNQAKFKDYRSKSQDLHCPPEQLREVNILFRFWDQETKRRKELQRFGFSGAAPIACLDFREFLAGLDEGSVDLVLTDPPWGDGNPYFEKAQLLHPWLNFSLPADDARMQREVVITDAPSRRGVHSAERWWQDLAELFTASYRVLRPGALVAFYFRPIPAARWLTNLNRLKLIARQNGFEPLLTIDVGSSDPSMRLQQSAKFVFADDIVFLFLKLTSDQRRTFVGDVDVDQLAFQSAIKLQEELRGPFDRREWQRTFAAALVRQNQGTFNSPRNDDIRDALFSRYCEQVEPGRYLPKAVTPYSGQLFDVPIEERIFTYVPQVIDELTRSADTFTYDHFLLRLSEFVENGTRALIEQVERMNLRAVLQSYAEPVGRGRLFRKRQLPEMPEAIDGVLRMDGYQFEDFVCNLLSAQGFTSIRKVGRSGDRGVDIAAIDPGRVATVIQCKRYFRHPVDATPVQRLHSFAVTRSAGRKILITTSRYTAQAKAEARLTQTELIDGAALERLIANHLPNFAG